MSKCDSEFRELDALISACEYPDARVELVHTVGKLRNCLEARKEISPALDARLLELQRYLVGNAASPIRRIREVLNADLAEAQHQARVMAEQRSSVASV